MGCIVAINLEGGDSTAMWIKSEEFEGVVNCPSDNRKFRSQGERPVANAILLLKN
jgi:exopolysaccharide biosynthesis protein